MFIGDRTTSVTRTVFPFVVFERGWVMASLLGCLSLQVLNDTLKKLYDF